MIFVFKITFRRVNGGFGFLAYTGLSFFSKKIKDRDGNN